MSSIRLWDKVAGEGNAAEPGTEDSKVIAMSGVMPQATDMDMSEDIRKEMGPGTGNHISAAFRNGYGFIAFHTEDEAAKAMEGDEHRWVSYAEW